MCDRQMGKREMLYYVQLCVFASEDSEEELEKGIKFRNDLDKFFYMGSKDKIAILERSILKTP